MGIVPRFAGGAQKRLPLWQATRLPGVLRVGIGWGLLMSGHLVVLNYIAAYLKHLGVPPFVTTVTLILLGAGASSACFSPANSPDTR